MRQPIFYRVRVDGRAVESFDYLFNARAYAKELVAKGTSRVEIKASDGRVIHFKGANS